jgi:uncharacterized OB-fold protein
MGTQTESYNKPLPRPTPTDQAYWDGLKRHEVLVQRCDACGSLQWYPRQLCSACTSFALSWTPVEPKGTIYSFTTQHHKTGSKFDHELPYSVAVVALDVSPEIKLVGRIDNVDVEDVRIGMDVRGVFVDATEDVTFLHFEPVGEDNE